MSQHNRPNRGRRKAFFRLLERQGDLISFVLTKTYGWLINTLSTPDENYYEKISPQFLNPGFTHFWAHRGSSCR
jgi:hypothetical protein